MGSVERGPCSETSSPPSVLPARHQWSEGAQHGGCRRPGQREAPAVAPAVCRWAPLHAARTALREAGSHPDRCQAVSRPALSPRMSGRGCNMRWVGPACEAQSATGCGRALPWDASSARLAIWTDECIAGLRASPCRASRASEVDAPSPQDVQLAAVAGLLAPLLLDVDGAAAALSDNPLLTGKTVRGRAAPRCTAYPRPAST